MTEPYNRYRAALEEIHHLAAVGPPAPPQKNDTPADRNQALWYNGLVRVAAIAEGALREPDPALDVATTALDQIALVADDPGVDLAAALQDVHNRAIKALTHILDKQSND